MLPSPMLASLECTVCCYAQRSPRTLSPLQVFPVCGARPPRTWLGRCGCEILLSFLRLRYLAGVLERSVAHRCGQATLARSHFGECDLLLAFHFHFAGCFGHYCQRAGLVRSRIGPGLRNVLYGPILAHCSLPLQGLMLFAHSDPLASRATCHVPSCARAFDASAAMFWPQGV